jgi:hypothetical protein
VQAVLDNTHIGMIKKFAGQAAVTDEAVGQCLEQTRSVMTTSHKLYVRYVRHALRSGQITPPYPFEGHSMNDETLINARARLQELLAMPPRHIDEAIRDRVFQNTSGLLARLRNY